MLRVKPDWLFIPKLGQTEMYVTYAIQSPVSTSLHVIVIHDVDTISDSIRTMVCDWFRLMYKDACYSKDTHIYVTGVIDDMPVLPYYQVEHL